MIELRGVGMKVPGFSLLEINLSVAQGEYFILLGPTGAGKTLLLETIAGVYTPGAGEIFINGREVTALPPEKRGVSIVYQDQALFPHLSVRNNILFGLKARKTGEGEREEILGWLGSLLGIEQLMERSPARLSGGERQKVALARALAVRPDLLLLDEPLSALDQESRERLQVDLKQVHRELGVTTLHVTHDFEEAMSLGQRIAVLDGGRVRQVGSPEDIFFRPVSVLVARYTMSRNIFNGKVVYRQNGRVIFETGSGWRLEASSGAREDNYACIRPEYIGISPLSPPEATNTFRGHVVDIAKRGVYNVIRVAVGASQVTSYALLKESRDLKAGQNVWISFEPEVVYLLKDAPVP